ncbi:GNAT family N-acetyltransferase [Priestia abyssalis]|uniref:GNAT family N-acetyltransferase n=1 Tax=Priestia abyssalis TaxID=1221450 RepID=UPI001474AF2F|nr:GNAT family N-acetyltransferase [Priestia abyssalis]
MEGVHARTHLTAAELEAITDLANTCNQWEQINLTIPLNLSILQSRDGKETNDFLYYCHGQLTGFLGMYSFSNKHEAEITIMVDPHFRKRHIASTLLKEASQHWKPRSIQSQLLITDRSSLSGKAFLTAINAVYRFSEYSMILIPDKVSMTNEKAVQLVRATQADHVHIQIILSESFSFSNETASEMIRQTISDSRHILYVARAGPSYIGTVTVSEHPEELYIRAFAVRSSYQGKGYGRKILIQLIETLKNQSKKAIMIEVETSNKNALHLYESCGFRVSSAYDYYSLQPAKKA